MAENATHTITCKFPTENALYMAYMPFLSGGGLFIRTNEQLQMGDKINLSVTLLSEPDPVDVQGKIVWVTPRGAQGSRIAGVGVQFTDSNARQFCNKIETLLAGMLKSSQITDTM